MTISLFIFLNLTLKVIFQVQPTLVHDGNKKILNQLCVQFCDKILKFEGDVMVQPSGAFFLSHPVYCDIYILTYAMLLPCITKNLLSGWRKKDWSKLNLASCSVAGVERKGINIIYVL